MELNQFRDVDVVLDKANDNFIQKQFVSAGDKDGRSLTVQITENGAVGEVIGLTLNLRWHNEASGLTDLSAFSVVDRTTSVFKIDYPQNMLTPGIVIAYIQILQDGKVTHTKPFEITVQNLAGTTRGVLATAEYSALVTTLAKANEFETEIAKKADKTQVDALGSEINVARGGAQTLGERLDREKAEFSAQLAQKATQTSLDITNASVIEFNNRVDNIIATPTTVSEQEIIDARQNKTSLGANLTAIKDDLATHKEDYVQLKDSTVTTLEKIVTDEKNVTPLITDWKYGSPNGDGSVNPTPKNRRWSEINVLPDDMLVIKNLSGTGWRIGWYLVDQYNIADPTSWSKYISEDYSINVSNISDIRNTKKIRVFIYKDGVDIITDEIMETFNIIFETHKKSVITNLYSSIDNVVNNKYINLLEYVNWEYGTVSESGITPSAKTRRWVDIPVNLDKNIKIKFSSDNWLIGFYEFDQHNNIFVGSWRGYYSTETNYMATVKDNDRYVSKLRLLIKHKTDAEITPVLLKTLDIKIEEETVSEFNKLANEFSNLKTLKNYSTLKVMTSNVGRWFNGVSYVPNSEVVERGIMQRKLFGKHDCDIVMGQEMFQYFDVDQSVEAIPFVLDFKYPYNTKHLSYGDVILSKFDLESVTKTNNGNSRYYIKGYKIIDGKKICFINTHCSLDIDPSIHREGEINRLISAMDAEEYVILGGDFNVFTKSEFDAFKNAGYELCSGGDFGWFDTWHNLDRNNQTWLNKAIDNIIVSSNISIQNVYMDDSRLSDHAPLIAELRID